MSHGRWRSRSSSTSSGRSSSGSAPCACSAHCARAHRRYCGRPDMGACGRCDRHRRVRPDPLPRRWPRDRGTARVGLRRAWLKGTGGLALGVAALTVLGVVGVAWIDGESWWWGPTMQRVGYSLLAISGGPGRRRGRVAERELVAARPLGELAPRVRQIQLLPVSDSLPGHAAGARVRARPRRVWDVWLALGRPTRLLRTRHGGGVRACVDVVARV